MSTGTAKRTTVIAVEELPSPPACLALAKGYVEGETVERDGDRWVFSSPSGRLIKLGRYGRKGTVLYLCEPWREADADEEDGPLRPARFMPRRLARKFARVESVECCRLDDVKLESKANKKGSKKSDDSEDEADAEEPKPDSGVMARLREQWPELENPWVFVYRVSRLEGPPDGWPNPDR